MKKSIKDFLNDCKTMNFGLIILSKKEYQFYLLFSKEVFAFCRSLPKSAQTDSILFLMKYGGINLGEKIDFFANYKTPTWSILYWLIHSHTLPTHRLKKADITNAITAHSMAMLLHSLDDHLIDNQIPVSPITLLLRTQAWIIMNRAFTNLSDGLPGGAEILEGFIDDYYSDLMDSKKPVNLDGYCHQFRKQMAIGMVVPILLSMKMNEKPDFIKDLELAFGSFGIAWRLLDDIQDMGRDFEKGTRSAIYLCLPKKLKTLWNNKALKGGPVGRDSTSVIFDYILEQHLVDKIKERIDSELESASAKVEAHGLSGLANEFKLLARPLRRYGEM